MLQLLIGAVGGIGLVIGALALMVYAPGLKRMRKPRWLCALLGEVPWARIRSFKVLGAEAGQHDVLFVSRHEVAECGLTCPVCKTVAADRADFHLVERTIIDGNENEVIKCPGIIKTSDDDPGTPCPIWLAASPDTDHGDHLDDHGEIDRTSECPPHYYRFKRITSEQALREKYGVDIVGQDGQAVAQGRLATEEELKSLVEPPRVANGVIPPEQIQAAFAANPEGVPSAVLGGLAAVQHAQPSTKESS